MNLTRGALATQQSSTLNCLQLSQQIFLDPLWRLSLRGLLKGRQCHTLLCCWLLRECRCPASERDAPEDAELSRPKEVTFRPVEAICADVGFCEGMEALSCHGFGTVPMKPSVHSAAELVWCKPN
jgi:hypothetical protein